jgi:hypothetical protein
MAAITIMILVFRHPSHTHLDSGVIHRVVSLNRNHSVAAMSHSSNRHSVPRQGASFQLYHLMYICTLFLEARNKSNLTRSLKEQCHQMVVDIRPKGTRIGLN